MICKSQTDTSIRYTYVNLDTKLFDAFVVGQIVRCIPAPTEQEQLFSTALFSPWHTFKHHNPRFLLSVGIYLGFREWIKPVCALILAGIPPFLIVIIKAIISRTLDALGCLVFLCFIILSIVSLTAQDLFYSFIRTTVDFQCSSFHQSRDQYPIRSLAFYFCRDLASTTRDELGLPEHLLRDQ